MKIVKHGMDKTFYTRCEQCATEFEYRLADTTFLQNPGYRASRFIRCPVCEAEFTVNLLTLEEFDQRRNSPGMSYCCC